MEIQKIKRKIVEKTMNDFQKFDNEFHNLLNRVEGIEQDIFDLHLEVKKIFMTLAKN